MFNRKKRIGKITYMDKKGNIWIKENYTYQLYPVFEFPSLMSYLISSPRLITLKEFLRELISDSILIKSDRMIIKFLRDESLSNVHEDFIINEYKKEKENQMERMRLREKKLKKVEKRIESKLKK